MEEINKIKKIVELVYLSSFLKNEKPLSLILIAPPEQSKTYFLLNFSSRYSHISTDLSYSGLINLLLKNKTIKHIVIPDFLKVTEKGNSTKKSIISALNSFTEEGIYEINLGNKEKINLKGRKGGIITATTTYSLYQNAKQWNGMGFKSRFISVKWKYSQETFKKILNKIAKEKNNKTKKTEIINHKIMEITLKDDFNDKLIELSDFSPRKLKNLKVLLKTIALKNNHKIVTEKDFNELNEIVDLINSPQKEI